MYTTLDVTDGEISLPISHKRAEGEALHSQREPMAVLEVYRRALGPEFYGTTISPLFVTATRSEFAKHPHDDIVPQALAIADGILTSLRKSLADQPIEILRVTIEDVDFPPEVSQAISREAVVIASIPLRARSKVARMASKPLFSFVILAVMSRYSRFIIIAK